MTLLSESDGSKPRLEDEEQKPIDIALAIFRFRARRGVGVYYALLATVPILVGVLDDASAPSYLTLIAVGLLILSILFVARASGMKRFYQMRLVMGLIEQNRDKQTNKFNGLLYGARTVFVTLLPVVAAAVFEATGSAVLGSIVLVALVVYLLAYYVLVFSRQSSSNVLPWNVEDWAVAICPTALLLSFFFQVIGISAYLVSLLLLLILAGIKSSFDAPKALVKVLNNRETQDNGSLKRQEEVNLSEIASGGMLSSFTRVGIMLALLGVEQITFTDLMFAIKVSKSSLNHSVNALSDAGYVTVRKGFETAGGPRTFIKITKEGKAAIHAHLENMQTLASKFLG